MTRTRFASLAVVAAVAVAAYARLGRPWVLDWGARPDEVDAALPGDDLLPGSMLTTTRAVTVEAPASAIWPWLVQMGPGRGGAYTYDWVENLFGLDMHSADRVLPEHQHLELGHEMRLGDDGPVMRVEVLEPERALVYRSDDGAWVWAFVLVPDGTRTRLISRNRIFPPGAGPWVRLAYAAVMEPGSLVMERKMLLGIKERAEGLGA
jgi:hypothetical protein